MKLKIRQVTMNDIEKLASVYDQDGQNHTRKLENYPLADWILSDNLIFLTTDPICGFIVVRKAGDSAKIDMLSVEKSYTSKGIEKSLLNEAEKYLDYYAVKVYVPKTNTTLLAVYHSCGYKVKDEVTDLFGSGVSGLLLEKTVSFSPSKRKHIKKVKKQVKPKPKKIEDPFKVIKPREVFEQKDALTQNLEKIDDLSVDEFLGVE